MEDIEKLLAEMSIVSFEVDTMHFVDITHITDPHNFYIRPVKYKKFLTNFASTEPTTKATSVNIKDIVVFNLGHSCGIKKFLRGRITNIENKDGNSTYSIFAIDFGFIDKGVPLEHIWKCNEVFTNMPPLATLCQLTNCYPVGRQRFPNETINAFKLYVIHESASMYIFGKKNEKLIVGLLNSHSDDITTLLAVGGYSEVGSGTNTKWTPAVVRRKLSYTFKSIKVNLTLHVRMQFGRSLKEFYVAAVGDYKKHMKEIDVITFYARRESSLCRRDFVEGELVCVRYDEQNIYERAIIKKVLDPEPVKKALVQLVDWGREEEVLFTKLKYMSSLCLRTPVLTIFCSAEDNEYWEDKMDDFLTPGFEFLITIKESGMEFEIPHVVEIHPLEEGMLEGASSIIDETVSSK